MNDIYINNYLKQETDGDKMTRKFLFCFPLRAGNVAFGCIVIIISIAVVAYHLYEFVSVLVKSEATLAHGKFDNWENLDNIFNQDKQHLVYMITLLYYITYVVLGLLLFIFAVILTCGASRANHCFVSTFFVYSFFHLFFTIGLVVWEATSAGWIQLGLILFSDLLLVICLFSVKYLMEAILTGNIYSRPGEVLYKY